MTENDKILIELANCVPYWDWYLITPMLDKAETPECRRELKSIQGALYHREEYLSGLG